MTEPISSAGFAAAEGSADWRFVGDGACAWFATGSFAAGARLVQAIGELPGLAEHQPDVDLRPEGVTVRVFTLGEDFSGLTQQDLGLARAISALAREQGLPADPAAVQSVQFSIDARVRADVMPFWAAVLGYRQAGPEDVVDPHRRGGPIWFQPMHPVRTERNRIHVDVWVPHDQAAARVAAALAAGGRIVRDRDPTWWTLADPEGNEVDVATWRGRD